MRPGKPGPTSSRIDIIVLYMLFVVNVLYMLFVVNVSVALGFFTGWGC